MDSGLGSCDISGGPRLEDAVAPVCSLLSLKLIMIWKHHLELGGRTWAWGPGSLGTCLGSGWLGAFLGLPTCFHLCWAWGGGRKVCWASGKAAEEEAGHALQWVGLWLGGGNARLGVCVHGIKPSLPASEDGFS